MKPAMPQHETNTWYDQNGSIALTNNKDLPGVGIAHKAELNLPNRRFSLISKPS
jgi:hypothetical protein